MNRLFTFLGEYGITLYIGLMFGIGNNDITFTYFMMYISIYVTLLMIHDITIKGKKA